MMSEDEHKMQGNEYAHVVLEIARVEFATRQDAGMFDVAHHFDDVECHLSMWGLECPCVQINSGGLRHTTTRGGCIPVPGSTA